MHAITTLTEQQQKPKLCSTGHEKYMLKNTFKLLQQMGNELINNVTFN